MDDIKVIAEILDKTAERNDKYNARLTTIVMVAFISITLICFAFCGVYMYRDKLTFTGEYPTTNIENTNINGGNLNE